MPESNFVDYVKIYCRSGKGGRGSTHMHRAKYMPKGGPDGGDGGRGGNIILRGNRNYWTLLHLKYQRHVLAGHGESGSKNRSFGKDGEGQGDRSALPAPWPITPRRANTCATVTEHGQEVILLKGGRGGLGNWHFRTATRQAPRFAQPGEPMQEMTVILELKLLADVGLVGFPTQASRPCSLPYRPPSRKLPTIPSPRWSPTWVSCPTAKASRLSWQTSPASSREPARAKAWACASCATLSATHCLLFMVPADADDIAKEYDILLNELKTFNPEMLDKQRVLAVTKCDMLDQELMDEIEPTLPAGIPHVFISSVSGLGIDVLKDILWTELNKESNRLEGHVESIAHRPKDMSHLAEECARKAPMKTLAWNT